MSGFVYYIMRVGVFPSVFILMVSSLCLAWLCTHYSSPFSFFISLISLSLGSLLIRPPWVFKFACPSLNLPVHCLQCALSIYLFGFLFSWNCLDLLYQHGLALISCSLINHLTSNIALYACTWALQFYETARNTHWMLFSKYFPCISLWYTVPLFFLSAILIRICMQIQVQMGLSSILSGRAFSVSSIWALFNRNGTEPWLVSLETPVLTHLIWAKLAAVKMVWIGIDPMVTLQNIMCLTVEQR